MVPAKDGRKQEITIKKEKKRERKIGGVFLVALNRHNGTSICIAKTEKTKLV